MGFVVLFLSQSKVKVLRLVRVAEKIMIFQQLSNFVTAKTNPNSISLWFFRQLYNSF